MKNPIICFFALLSLFSCKSDAVASEEENVIATSDETVIESTTRGTEHFCYQLKEGSDIIEVYLTVEDDAKVTGTYNWIPSEKDARKGSLTGVLKEGTIEATYIYVQEGEESTEKITLVLQPEGIQVSGEEKELPQIDCK